MRIIALGVEEDDARLLVGLAVALGVAQTQDLVARGDIDRAVRMAGDVHRGRRALVEGGEAVGLAVAVGVFEDADAVELRPLVVGRREVRVALDDQQPAAGVEVEANGMDDVRSGGEQIDTQTVIGGTGFVRGAAAGSQHAERQQQWDGLHGKVSRFLGAITIQHGWTSRKRKRWYRTVADASGSSIRVLFRSSQKSARCLSV